MGYGNISNLIAMTTMMKTLKVKVNYEQVYEGSSSKALSRCLDRLNGGLTPLADFIATSPLCLNTIARSAQVKEMCGNIK